MADPTNPTLDETADMFAGMKKKKKSKKVVFDEELESSPAPVATVPTSAPAIEEKTVPAEPTAVPTLSEEPAAVSDELDFSDLKKKKKKKTVKVDDEDLEPAAAPVASGPKVDKFGNVIAEDQEAHAVEAKQEDDGGVDLADEFADLKKKKKKGSKKAAFDLEAFERELQEAEGSKEGSKVNSEDEADGEGIVDDAPVDGEDPFAKEGEEGTQSKAERAAEAKLWLKEGDRDYTYTELLGRFYASLYVSHPSLSGAGGKRRYTLAPPQMYREGNKRSVFANIVDICKKMHRQPEHVIQFLFAELGTQGSVDGSGRLVIKGRFQQKQIENVLRRYIMEYVTCRTCKSPDTLLTKDNRLFFVTCESCGSTRSVSAVKTGFAAQIGKRKKAA